MEQRRRLRAVEHLAERGALHPEIVAEHAGEEQGIVHRILAGKTDGGDLRGLGDGVASISTHRPAELGDGSSTMSSLGWIAATPSIANDVGRTVGGVHLLLEHDARRGGRQHLGAEGQRAEHVTVGREQPVGDQEAGADVLAGFRSRPGRSTATAA